LVVVTRWGSAWVGDPVVLWSDSRNPRCRTEYGRVIDSFWNRKLACWDYYVAFFGSRWLVLLKRPPRPYVLRYLESSLKPHAPK
jgi:hypothetical protein